MAGIKVVNSGGVATIQQEKFSGYSKNQILAIWRALKLRGVLINLSLHAQESLNAHMIFFI